MKSMKSHNCPGRSHLVLAGAACLALAAPVLADELLVGSVAGQRLVLFSSSDPVTVMNLKGLAQGEEIVGLDQRIATGELYALASSSRLYTIDLASRTATVVHTEPLFPALEGTTFGFDFNPTVDRIRIVSDAGQNLRAHPDLGSVVFVDGMLEYAAGDPASGWMPTVAASAYSNNDNDPATGTTLFNLDVGTDMLVVQNPPNAGVLNTVGPLGIDVEDVAGFDIAASDGTAYAALVEAGQPGKSARSALYTIDLNTGAATYVGEVRGPKPLLSLTAMGTLP
jgi:hypothetical protein